MHTDTCSLARFPDFRSLSGWVHRPRTQGARLDSAGSTVIIRTSPRSLLRPPPAAFTPAGSARLDPRRILGLGRRRSGSGRAPAPPPRPPSPLWPPPQRQPERPTPPWSGTCRSARAFACDSSHKGQGSTQGRTGTRACAGTRACSCCCSCAHSRRPSEGKPLSLSPSLSLSREKTTRARKAGAHLVPEHLLELRADLPPFHYALALLRVAPVVGVVGYRVLRPESAQSLRRRSAAV